ncbi:PKD domain-containing protein [Mangrovivirga sp. M17]|uniref:PKD domain-containing protein n=1 Tax=Mangrovivirga halotolerans TaxID=2993936 RepID=A0ABT3RLQ6_9BACT|nr:PKD domain-containing protein [Mangrovivirga halotolerans]MCX2742748.1 PKD domain-containing protein [Mangrovivirga halotolerans]
MKKLLNIFFIATLVILGSCEEEEFSLGNPPSDSEAEFTIEPSPTGTNRYILSTNSSGFINKWDLGNGAPAEGREVEAYFPFAGEYEISLSSYFKGGSASTSQTLTVETTDPEICNNEILTLLTGGCESPEGKTWVIDASRSGHFGVGPTNEYYPIWYEAGAFEKQGGGLYNDEYTFVLQNYVFDQETNGDIYLNGAQASNFPGAYENPDVGDFTAPYTAPENINYAIFVGPEGYTNITFNNGGFIGYNTGVSTYQIISIEQNEIFLRFKDAANPDLRWYHRLIPADYEPVSADFSYATSGLDVTFTNNSLNATTYQWDFGDGNTSTAENPTHSYAADGTYTVTLTASGNGEEATFTTDISVVSIPIAFPITFEDGDILFGGFGGTVFNVIDNPDPSGVNTSSRVGEYIKGTEGSWAGIEITLDETIDFTNNSTLAMKVWSPVTGRALFKIEVVGDNTQFVEVFADITEANTWQQLTFDFSGAESNKYGKIALFMDFDNNNGGTFYVDDIGYSVAESNELTLEALTGGGSKSWVLKPTADSFGVGPAKGSMEWYPGWGTDISGQRPCLYNDEYIFKSGGQYEYQTNGDIFGEGYMGFATDECTDAANLVGTDAEAWGSGIHSFSLEPATESEPAYITVRGTGAFIALPKAYNGGEYASAPPNMDQTVRYEVLDYTKNASGEELTITIDVSEGETGGAYWSFVLVPNN